MKRGILLILTLVLLVDLAEDGCLGNVKFGPLRIIVSTSFSNSPHHHSRQVDFSYSLPSLDLRKILPEAIQLIKQGV